MMQGPTRFQGGQHHSSTALFCSWLPVGLLYRGLMLEGGGRLPVVNWACVDGEVPS